MQIRIFVRGYIRSVSGEGRSHGSYIGVEPVVCSISEPGYFPSVHSANLNGGRLTNLKAEIEHRCRPLVPREGQGISTIDVELTTLLAQTELALAKRLSQSYADEAAARIQLEIDENQIKARAKRLKKESFERYLSMLPDSKSIDGVLTGEGGGLATLTAYSDGLGFTRYQFASFNGPALPRKAYGGQRFESLEEAFEFGFQAHQVVMP